MGRDHASATSDLAICPVIPSDPQVIFYSSGKDIKDVIP
jgi:hypothetical protein